MTANFDTEKFTQDAGKLAKQGLDIAHTTSTVLLQTAHVLGNIGTFTFATGTVALGLPTAIWGNFNDVTPGILTGLGIAATAGSALLSAKTYAIAQSALVLEKALKEGKNDAVRGALTGLKELTGTLSFDANVLASVALAGAGLAGWNTIEHASYANALNGSLTTVGYAATLALATGSAGGYGFGALSSFANKKLTKALGGNVVTPPQA